MPVLYCEAEMDGIVELRIGSFKLCRRRWSVVAPIPVLPFGLGRAPDEQNAALGDAPTLLHYFVELV